MIEWWMVGVVNGCHWNRTDKVCRGQDASDVHGRDVDGCTYD